MLIFVIFFLDKKRTKLSFKLIPKSCKLFQFISFILISVELLPPQPIFKK